MEDQTNNRIREEWKKEFRKQFIWDDENELGMPTNPFPSSDRVISFIAELLKSQRDEERLRSAKIVEELMDDSEHWQPIASRIMDRVIIGKEDLSLIKNNNMKKCKDFETEYKKEIFKKYLKVYKKRNKK